MRKLIYLFIIFSVCSNTVNAQSDESQDAGERPSLNGHMFPSTNYLRSSFVVTSLQVDMGVGITSTLLLPGIMIGENEILSFEGKILFADVDVQYQQHFTPWLSLFLSFRLAGRLGTSMSTILLDGLNTISGFDIGWLIRIWESDKLNLAGTIKLSTATGNFINVAEYFEEIINNEPYPSVIKRITGLTAGLGLRGAYAFNRTYGIQFNMDYAYGESFERVVSKGYYIAGILGDMDFKPKHKVPIGLALGYTISTSPAYVIQDGGISNIIIGKIGYTGSEDFDLGLQFNYRNIYLSSVDDKPFIKTILLNLRYYF